MAAVATTPATADIVNEWFRERIATGAIGRHTEAYNQASAALPDLIARLAAAPVDTAAPADAATADAAPAAGKSTRAAAA